jgi:transposase
VDTTESESQDGRARRRRHSAEFKATVVAECNRPGVSIAAVALRHQLNANLLRRWVVDAKGDAMPKLEWIRDAEASPAVGGFVPVQIESSQAARATTIDVELHRGPIAVKVSWPVSAALECGVWLREVLR